MSFTVAKKARGGVSGGSRMRRRAAFHPESLESRRLLSAMGTNPFASTPGVAAPAAVGTTTSTPAATPATNPGASQAASPFSFNFGSSFNNFNAWGGGTSVIASGGSFLVIEQLPITITVEFGSGLSGGGSEATMAGALTGSTAIQSQSATTAVTLISPYSPSTSSTTTTTTTPAASSPLNIPALAFAAITTTTTATTTTPVTTPTRTTPTAVGQSGAVAAALVFASVTTTPTNSLTSLLSETRGATSIESAVLGQSLLTTSPASSSARIVQPLLGPSVPSRAPGSPAEDEPPAQPELLVPPTEIWMTMPPLHLSATDRPAHDGSGEAEAWDSAVSAFFAEQVEAMAASSPERLPALNEASENAAPLESALAIGLAVTTWVAWERRAKGSDRLRRRLPYGLDPAVEALR